VLAGAEANDSVARKIYELRTRAVLTQQQLAKRVGTTTSVISRLEDADYEGHSLAMLRRIAAALNKHVCRSEPPPFTSREVFDILLSWSR